MTTQTDAILVANNLDPTLFEYAKGLVVTANPTWCAQVPTVTFKAAALQPEGKLVITLQVHCEPFTFSIFPVGEAGTRAEVVLHAPGSTTEKECLLKEWPVATAELIQRYAAKLEDNATWKKVNSTFAQQQLAQLLQASQQTILASLTRLPATEPVLVRMRQLTPAILVKGNLLLEDSFTRGVRLVRALEDGPLGPYILETVVTIEEDPEDGALEHVNATVKLPLCHLQIGIGRAGSGVVRLFARYDESLTCEDLWGFDNWAWKEALWNLLRTEALGAIIDRAQNQVDTMQEIHTIAQKA